MSSSTGFNICLNNINIISNAAFLPSNIDKKKTTKDFSHCPLPHNISESKFSSYKRKTSHSVRFT